MISKLVILILSSLSSAALADPLTGQLLISQIPATIALTAAIIPGILILCFYKWTKHKDQLAFFGFALASFAFLLFYTGYAAQNILAAQQDYEFFLKNLTFHFMNLSLIVFTIFHLDLKNSRRDHYNILRPAFYFEIFASLAALAMPFFPILSPMFAAISLIGVLGTLLLVALKTALSSKKSTWIFTLGLSFYAMSFIFALLFEAFQTASWQLFPPLLLASSMFFFALSVLESFKKSQKTKMLIKHSLTSKIPPHLLSSLADNPRLLTANPVETEATLMLVDIQGIPYAVEHWLKTQVLDQMKDVFSNIGQKICEHGGMIGQSLDSSMMVGIFGYSADGKKSAHHADIAIKAAIELQKQILDSILASGEGQILLPLRIGLFTDKFLIGNLGISPYIEYSVLGNNVSTGQKLVTACNPFKVIFSQETYQSTSNRFENPKCLNKILIKTALKDDLIEVIEYNPFWENKDDLIQVDHKLWKYHKANVREPRISVRENAVEMHSAIGDAQILDASIGGFSTLGHFYVGRGVHFLIDIFGGDKTTLDHLRDIHLMPIGVQVCWGRPSNPGFYKHGYRFIGLNQNQKQTLHRYFLATHHKRYQKKKAS